MNINKHKIANGFSLLEVLITVVIFSVALLGLATIQITGLRLSHDSLLRGSANLLASDMADRMRSNLAAGNLGVASPYNNPTGAATGNPSCLAKDSNGNEINANCNSTQMAQHDFYEWLGAIGGRGATSWHPAIKTELSNGSGIVCVDSTPDDGAPGAPACDNIVVTPGKVIYAIKIWWSERKDADSPETFHRYVMDFSL